MLLRIAFSLHPSSLLGTHPHVCVLRGFDDCENQTDQHQLVQQYIRTLVVLQPCECMICWIHFAFRVRHNKRHECVKHIVDSVTPEHSEHYPEAM